MGDSDDFCVLRLDDAADSAVLTATISFHHFNPQNEVALVMMSGGVEKANDE